MHSELRHGAIVRATRETTSPHGIDIPERVSTGQDRDAVNHRFLTHDTVGRSVLNASPTRPATVLLKVAEVNQSTAVLLQVSFERRERLSELSLAELLRTTHNDGVLPHTGDHDE